MNKKIIVIVWMILVISTMTKATVLTGGDFVIDIQSDPSATLGSQQFVADVVYGNYFHFEFPGLTGPIVIITSPLHEQAVNGTFSLNWTTTDAELDNYLTNVTLLNGTLIASGLYKSVTNYTINSSIFADGFITFVVTSCENETVERLCGNDTKRVEIRNTVVSSEYIGIALMFFGVTLIFTVLTIISQSLMWKFIFGISTLFLVVADFMVGKNILRIISPQSTSLISILDNQYFIWLQFLLLAVAGGVIAAIYSVVMAIKNSGQLKRDRKSQEFDDWQ